MADNIPQVTGMGGLAQAINPAGLTSENLTEYQKTLRDAMTSLQQRYENPNWFNVAAGFFKPQLGGFAASLGSASQALGENLEKQRQTEIPLAQMKVELFRELVHRGVSHYINMIPRVIQLMECYRFGCIRR